MHDLLYAQGRMERVATIRSDGFPTENRRKNQIAWLDVIKVNFTHSGRVLASREKHEAHKPWSEASGAVYLEAV